MLELIALRRRFGDVVALDDLSVSIPAGEVFGLLGPNGAGKTTAMRIVMGVLTPDGGQALWHGAPITLDSRRRFGYLPEERGLYPSMTAREHLIYTGRLHGMTRADAIAAS